MVLEKDVDERQIVALTGGRSGPVFATTNAAAVFSIGSEGEPQRELHERRARCSAGGPLRHSPVAGRAATREQGRVLSAQWNERRARPHLVSLDSGEGWSRCGPGSCACGKVSAWRADLVAANGEEPVISDVTISYVQENLAPRIKRFSAMGPGEIIVPANFNPGNQVFEPTSPIAVASLPLSNPPGRSPRGVARRCGRRASKR